MVWGTVWCVRAWRGQLAQVVLGFAAEQRAASGVVNDSTAEVLSRQYRSKSTVTARVCTFISVDILTTRLGPV